ncbi:SAM-dependent methyltransferase [Prosthecochloris marina]|uniref:Arsenite methyltransferase n=1 Tax=Prosthecochloris marina TaxID=2017681 RepID=A0A317T9Z0_9CHLB|nr:class I SAM-dependent methyltransferase [Prosthecochloris marina]PWW83308.1 SAM-dependent methyltransferase [Prosthecochloris marina]
MGNNRVCPVERSGSLDTGFRKWLQDSQKILHPYVKEGMTVLDFGCGSGFFTVDMAHMVGESGRIIAVDLQEGMLEKLREKIQGTEYEERIILHKCEKDTIGIAQQVDFILAFYVVHEVPHQDMFFKEIQSTLKKNGLMLVVEPPFHVSAKAFRQEVEKAQEAGLTACEGPKVLFGKTVILKKGK